MTSKLGRRRHHDIRWMKICNGRCQTYLSPMVSSTLPVQTNALVPVSSNKIILLLLFLLLHTIVEKGWFEKMKSLIWLPMYLYVERGMYLQQ